MVASPMIVFGSSMLRRLNVNSASAGGSSAMNDLFAEVVGEGIRVASTAAVTLGLALLVGGVVLSLAGGAYFVRRYITEISAILFRTRLALGFWAIVAYGMVFVLHEGVRYASLEVARVVVASTTVFGISLLFLVRGDRGANPLTRVLIIGPAMLSAIFLSVIAGMLASALFSNLVVQVTDEFVEFMLLDVFAIVGLNTVLTSLFELQGAAYLLVWVGVTFVAGWGLGAVFVAFDVSVTDSVRRFVPV